MNVSDGCCAYVCVGCAELTAKTNVFSSSAEKYAMKIVKMALQEFSALQVQMKRFLINYTKNGLVYYFIFKINYIMKT